MEDFMKKNLLFIALTIAILLPLSLFSQTGSIAGKVTIGDTGKPLPNAAVIVTDLEMGTYTKDNGTFILRNVPVGTHTISISFVGYQKETKVIDVKDGLTEVIDFEMMVKAVEMGGINVSATRAKKRETPIAFTDVKKDVIESKYTTEDMPQLLEGVPGLFSATGGLGEGELKVRGFDQDKVQIMINGIPVNDPESQQVYWSNWTGLSSNVKSVQVQRGAGTSMYGSGAFGGSVNIETIGVTETAEKWTFRTSGGFYDVQNKVADGKGNMVDFTPYNYNLLARYNSGNLYGGKFSYSAMVERKAGSSYNIGTDYDGWSYGVETKHVWGDHLVNVSFIAAPQEHHQMRTTTDMNLESQLGRAYNRNNNEEQVNYYNKPQLSIRDEWQISPNSLLLTNFFITRGDGGGKYLRNDTFDVTTGKIGYQDISEYSDWKYFGRHALDVYQQTGVVLEGFNPADSTYSYKTITDTVAYGNNLPNGDYSHTWTNDSQNNHKQFGFNTYYDHTMNDIFKFVVGGEWRYWKALHHAQGWDFRYTGGFYDQHQDRYKYYGIVNNTSVFARTNIKPMSGLNILLDGQYAIYNSEVEEQPIQIFDYQRGVFTDDYYYATKANHDEDDYKKTYTFFSPKAGVNYNLTEYFNVLANYSIAYKEPKVGDWYSRSSGPDAYQTDDQGNVNELDPEKATTTELGIGYDGVYVDVNMNLYMTNYEDKIESTLLENGDYLTVNAGKSKHQGVELFATGTYKNWDGNFSLTYAQNRWEKMNVDEIFGIPAEDIKDKVVPYAPEQMASAGLGYTFPDLPMDGSLRIGLSGNWWDEYYGTYTNEYQQDNGNPFDGQLGPVVSSKLPYFLSLNSNITYNFKISNRDASLRLDLRNLNNREDNYSRAYYTADYGRNDDLGGKDYMYVTPAPLFNAFLTLEVNF
jgi:outer membrane receptor protein involved in Fe transport